MNHYHKTICIIPALKESKKIQFRNTIEIYGKPFVSYSVTEAINTKLFNEVYVATEDQEIADISRRYGAIVPCLIPKEVVGNHLSAWLLCNYLIDYLKEKEGKEYESVLCLQPTAILRKSIDIIKGMKIFFQGNYDFLVSVTPIDPHFFHWAMVQNNENNSWKLYFDENYLFKDKKELPRIYRPNGAIKIANIKKIKDSGHFFGKNLGVVFMPEKRSLLVLSDFDFKVATLFLEKNENK